MKFLTIAFLCLFASPVLAACHAGLSISPPQQHEVLACEEKPHSARHFKIFDANHLQTSLRKQGDVQRLQLKYTGDWTVSPTRIQLVPYYLDQVRKWGGKLLFEDAQGATYKYYFEDKTYWLELNIIGDGLHGLTILTQTGIILDAQYNVAQIKSRLKRYGKVVFYRLDQNVASFTNLVKFLNQSADRFYLVSHNFGGTADENEGDSVKTAQKLAAKLTLAKVKTGQIISKGIGALSPLKPPQSVNSQTKNTRTELVVR